MTLTKPVATFTESCSTQTGKKRSKPHSMLRSLFGLMLLVLCWMAADYSVNAQFYYIHHNYAKSHISQKEYNEYKLMVTADVKPPYRYRILTYYIFDSFFSGGRAEFEPAVYRFRFIQNFLIFLLAFFYFKSYRMKEGWALLAVFLMILPMSNHFQHAAFAFYTQTQVIFTLLALILIERRMLVATIMLTLLAAFNREEAVFIPLLLLARHPKHWKHATAGIVAFLCVYFGIRWALGTGGYEYALARSRYLPGVALFVSNIANKQTWIGLFPCVEFLPVSLLFIKFWPAQLKRYGLVMLLWCAAEFYFGSTDETRLLLAPIVLILVPAGVFLVARFVEDTLIRKTEKTKTIQE